MSAGVPAMMVRAATSTGQSHHPARSGLSTSASVNRCRIGPVTDPHAGHDGAAESAPHVVADDHVAPAGHAGHDVEGASTRLLVATAQGVSAARRSEGGHTSAPARSRSASRALGVSG